MAIGRNNIWIKPFGHDNFFHDIYVEAAEGGLSSGMQVKYIEYMSGTS